MNACPTNRRPSLASATTFSKRTKVCSRLHSVCTAVCSHWLNAWMTSSRKFCRTQMPTPRNTWTSWSTRQYLSRSSTACVVTWSGNRPHQMTSAAPIFARSCTFIIKWERFYNLRVWYVFLLCVISAPVDLWSIDGNFFRDLSKLVSSLDFSCSNLRIFPHNIFVLVSNHYV